jgi:hypothetical protein
MSSSVVPGGSPELYRQTWRSSIGNADRRLSPPPESSARRRPASCSSVVPSVRATARWSCSRFSRTCSWATPSVDSSSAQTPPSAAPTEMIACAAEVDRRGVVSPNWNGPHSSWPYAAQPSGSDTRSARSAHESCACGQFSASAIGRGIASTVGERATDGAVSGASCAPCSWERSICSHDVASAIHTSGGGPKVRSSQPFVRLSTTSAEESAITWTASQSLSLRRW